MYLYVTNVCSPTEFFGFISESANFLQFPQLIADTCEELWRQNASGRVDLTKLTSLKKPQIKNIMVKLAGNSWLRCSMVEKGGASTGGQVSVTLMDGGRNLVVPSTTPAVQMTQAIKQLPSSKFSLSDVLPVIGEKNAWPKTARDIFSTIALNQVFLVSNYGSDGSVCLNDIKNGESIGMRLIKLGVARPAGDFPIAQTVVSDLPIESQVFLERTGGLNVANDQAGGTSVSIQAILNSISQSGNRH